MPHEWSPTLLKEMEALMPLLAGRKPLERGDVEGRRARFNGMAELFQARVPQNPGVVHVVHTTPSPISGAPDIEIHQFSAGELGPKDDANKTAAVVHVHGGGMIVGSAETFGPLLGSLAENTGCPMFSVEYTLAPEAKAPTQAEECLAALQWLHKHAEQFGIDSKRIAIYGESAGGGIAASTTLLARSRGLNPPIAKQVLVYPMLDDRTTTTDPHLEGKLFWTWDDNATGWESYRGDKFETADDEGFACPARALDLAGLPRAYIDVGSCDAFRDEDVEYALRLVKAGVEVELHVYPGLPHAFEALCPQADFTQNAMGNRVRALRNL